MHPSEIAEEKSDDFYSLSTSLDGENFYFTVTSTITNMGTYYNVYQRPDNNGLKSEASYLDWQQVLGKLSLWGQILREELDTPDLWAEAAKTAQLFAGTTDAPDDKFTRHELAEVQGQLRQLQQSFAAAALPEAARQKLIELTQTAAVKAESLTKKDWQNWIIGGFISSITALALNPTQASEVLKLVKAAFGGLFLH